MKTGKRLLAKNTLSHGFSSMIFIYTATLRMVIKSSHLMVSITPSQLPGKYILAQDSVDNNFTVVAHLNNGKLKFITLTDRDDDFTEISD